MRDRELREIEKIALENHENFFKLIEEIMKSIDYKMRCFIPQKISVELTESILGTLALTVVSRIFSRAYTVEDLNKVSDDIQRGFLAHFENRKSKILEIN